MYSAHSVTQNLEGLFIQAQQRAEARTREIETLRAGFQALGQSILERLALLQREQEADVSLMNQYRQMAQGSVPQPGIAPNRQQQPQQQQQPGYAGQQQSVPLSQNARLSPQDIANMVPPGPAAPAPSPPNGQDKKAQG